MSKASLVVILGIVMLVVTVVEGLPASLAWWLVVISSSAIIILGLLLRVERQWLLRALSGGHRTDAYEESSSPRKHAE